MGLDFQPQCEQAALPLCKLIGPENEVTGQHMILAKCYSRSVDLANTLIFQGANDVAHVVALIMASIMVIHVRSKYTAVGT